MTWSCAKNTVDGAAASLHDMTNTTTVVATSRAEFGTPSGAANQVGRVDALHTDHDLVLKLTNEFLHMAMVCFGDNGASCAVALFFRLCLFKYLGKEDLLLTYSAKNNT